MAIQAFREEDGRLTVPGPLVRVPAGSEIRVSIRNDIPGTSLTVFGLSDRPAGQVNAPLSIPAGETRDVRFAAREPGTYHYWARTSDRPLTQRRDVDSQLGGALIVDPPGPPVQDRVFVIGLWRKPGTGMPGGGPPFEIGAINGRSWPHTEVFDHRVGDTVRWRVVNLSFDHHAMHLHGNFFDVVSTGDGLASRTFPPGEQPHVVTEHLLPGETMDMNWIPSRAGNWLLHCHMVGHMTPPGDTAASPVAHHAEDASAGMAGLVLGIRVAGASSDVVESASVARRFRLRLREEPNRYGDVAGYRMDVEGLETTRLGAGPVPGPLIAHPR